MKKRGPLRRAPETVERRPQPGGLVPSKGRRPVGRRGRRAAGFTLIELMIVVAILGILYGVVAVNFGDMNRKTVEARTKANLGRMRVGLDAYRAHEGIINGPEYITGTAPGGESDVLISGLTTFAIAGNPRDEIRGVVTTPPPYTDFPPFLNPLPNPLANPAADFIKLNFTPDANEVINSGGAPSPNGDPPNTAGHGPGGAFGAHRLAGTTASWYYNSVNGRIYINFCTTDMRGTYYWTW